MIPHGVRVVAGGPLPGAADAPAPLDKWEVNSHLAVVGSMKTGKTTGLGMIVENFLASTGEAAWLLWPEKDTRSPDGLFRSYGDLLCASGVENGGARGEKRLVLVNERDAAPIIAAMIGTAPSLSPVDGSPLPLPGLILAEESHLLHPETQNLLLSLVSKGNRKPEAEGMTRTPPPWVVFVSILRGISGEPLEWGEKCTRAADTVHLAASCEAERCTGAHNNDGTPGPRPRWDVVSVHRDQLGGKKFFRVGDLVGGHRLYINLCEDCRRRRGVDLAGVVVSL